MMHETSKINNSKCIKGIVIVQFNNLTQMHNFTVSAQDIFTFRQFKVFTVSFTGISQILMR